MNSQINDLSFNELKSLKLPLIHKAMHQGKYQCAYELCVSAIEGVKSNNSRLISVLNQNLEYAKKQLKADNFSVSPILNPNKSDTLILLCNGPSLKDFMYKKRYLDVIRQYDTFGLNAAYRIYDKLDFWPTYFGCFDMVVVKSHARQFKYIADKFKKMFLIPKDFEGNDLLGFEHSSVTKVTINKKSKFCRNRVLSERFDNLNHWLNSGTNAVQIALMLGYKQIIILGLDARYKENLSEVKHTPEKNRSNALTVTKRIKNNPNYWFEGYQKPGDKFNKPQTDTYILPAWNELGLSDYSSNIINCTPETAVTTIRRESFEELFSVKQEYIFNKKILFKYLYKKIDLYKYINGVFFINGLLYLLTEKDNLLYKKLYREKDWNKLIKRWSCQKAIVYKTELDFGAIPFKGYSDKLPYN